MSTAKLEFGNKITGEKIMSENDIGDVQIDFVSQNEPISIGNMSIADPASMRPYICEKTKTPRVMTFNGSKYVSKRTFNATLRTRDWLVVDDAVLRAARQRQVVVEYFRSKGLVYNPGTGMGKTSLETWAVNDPFSASISMDGRARADADMPDFTSASLPLPIVHVDFQIPERFLIQAKQAGTPIDPLAAELAATAVSEKVEDMVVNGTDTAFTHAGGTVRGLSDYGNRITYTLSTHWDDMTDTTTATVGEQIVADVSAMMQLAKNARKYGPYVLIVPTAYEMTLEEDYNQYTTETVRERLLKFNSVNDVIVSDFLDADNVLLVEESNTTFRVVEPMGISTIQWKSGDGFTNYFKVMQMLVPQPRADYNSRCGIVHAS
jgi:hypothetical protein